MSQRSCAGIAFFATKDTGLCVEYTFVKSRGPERFQQRLPNTDQHPLQQKLLLLHPLLIQAMDTKAISPDLRSQILKAAAYGDPQP